MKHWVCLGLTTALVITCTAEVAFLEPAEAIGSRTISREFARRGFTVKVTAVGVALSFLESGEHIQHVQLSPQRDIVVSADGPLCQGGEQNCGQGMVQVLFLRRIRPLSFPGQLPSPDGSSLLQVVTRSARGTNFYQFRLVPSSRPPEYTALHIGEEPSIRPLPPPVRSNSVVSKPLPSTPASVRSFSHVAAPTLVRNTEGLKPSKTPVSAPSISLPAAIQGPARQPQNPVPAPSSQPQLAQSLPKPSKEPPPERHRHRQQPRRSQTTATLPPFSSPPDPQPRSQPGLPPEPSSKEMPHTALRTPAPTDSPVDLANTLSRGLPVAIAKRQIGRFSSTYARVQSAIAVLRRGQSQSLVAAARQVGLPASVLQQLYTWGGG